MYSFPSFSSYLTALISLFSFPLVILKFKLYAKYIMQNARLDETQAGIKIAGKNINNLRYADDTTLMEESKENQRAS